MDRAIITGMVEDFWRSLIPAMQGGNSDLAAEMMGRFNERIADTASRMSPIESAGFLQMVDAERDKIINEYQTNPRALKARLDISQGIDGTPPRQRGRQGLGELAVRTAVRATVWESIWALFRFGR